MLFGFFFSYKEIKPFHLVYQSNHHRITVLDFQAVVYINTILTRRELTAILEPDYKIAKMQRLDQEPAEDA